MSHFIYVHFNFDRSNFNLSLNGKDPIDGHDGTQLDEFGIVSGDLIIILVDSEVLQRFVDQPAPPQPTAQMPESVPQAAMASTSGRPNEGTAGPVLKGH